MNDLSQMKKLLEDFGYVFEKQSVEGFQGNDYMYMVVHSRSNWFVKSTSEESALKSGFYWAFFMG